MAKSHETPIRDRIKKWAYYKNKKDPQPDWEEQIATIEHVDFLLDLASDPKCPQRVYMLKWLYLLVGTIVSRNEQTKIQKIHTILEKAHSSTDIVMVNWVSRSKIIIQDLRKYDYIEWCQGGFVTKDLLLLG